MAAAVALFLSPKHPLFFTPSLNPITTPNKTTHHHSQFHGKRLIPKIPFSSSFGNYRSSSSNNPPETECPVPLDQQPINEYQSLSTSSPFSWASGDVAEYCSRLFVTGASVSLFVGLPVSWYGSVGLEWAPLTRALGSISAGLFAVTLAVVRMYLGWAYVGNRLLSATIEYEETGWYDGQMWVKTAEVLARDRLLGSYSVKPVLSRLKNTLVGLALALFMCILLLLNTEGNPNNAYLTSGEAGGRSVSGVYNDESARSFEPEPFCGESGIP